MEWLCFVQVAELAEELAGEPEQAEEAGGDCGGDCGGACGRAGGEDAGLFALYLAGTPFAEADARKLNAGGALLSKALLAVSGASDVALTAAYRRHGDMGAAALRSADGVGLRRLGETGGADAGGGGRCVRGDGGGEDDGDSRGAGGGVAAAGDSAGGEVSAEADAGGHADWGEAESGGGGDCGGGRSCRWRRCGRAVMLEADLAGAVRRAFAGTLDEARMRLFHPLGFMLASPVETPEEAVERFTEKPVKVAKAKKGGGRKKGCGSHRWRMNEAECDRNSKATAGPSTRAARIAQDDNVCGDAKVLGLRRFWRTSTTGCGRRCIVGMPGSRGGWRSTRATGRM